MKKLSPPVVVGITVVAVLIAVLFVVKTLRSQSASGYSAALANEIPPPRPNSPTFDTSNLHILGRGGGPAAVNSAAGATQTGR